MESKASGLMKNAFFMVFATLFSKALGLVRDMLIASAYGTGADAIAYDAASRLPILLFDFVIGGVVTAAFIPIFNELLVKKGEKKAFDFASSYVTLVVLVTLTISIIGVAFAKPLVSFFIPDVAPEIQVLAVKLTRIMFPMIVFTGLAFAFVGVLLSLGEFRIPAIISLVSNGVIVAYLLSVNKIFGVLGLSISLLFGWMLQAFVQLPSLNSRGYRYRPSFKFNTPYIKAAARGALPILLGTWTAPVCALINTRFASAIEGGRAVTALGYANRFYIIIIGVFSYVATNLLFPYISKASAGGEKEEANKLMLSSIRILTLVIMPITAGIIVLAEPLVSLLYERGEFGASDVLMTATALRYYTVGMVFTAANEVLTKAFFARKSFKIPMYASICSMAANFIILFALRSSLSIGLIALASGIASAVGCVISYLAMLNYDKVLFALSDGLAIFKMLISAAVMGVCVYFVSGLFDGTLVKLIVGVGTGALVYFVLCALTRLDEAKYVLRALKRGEKTK